MSMLHSRRIFGSLALLWSAAMLVGTGPLAAAELFPAEVAFPQVPGPEAVFQEDAPPEIAPEAPESSDAPPPAAELAPLPADPDACIAAPGLACFDVAEDQCWLHSDKRLLHMLQDCELGCDWTYSVGAGLRYRYLDERNRLRPPLAAGRSSYEQWRFTPWAQLNYKDLASIYLQGIDAPTFGNELPLLPIDENRADVLQMYADFNVLSLDTGDVHYRYGRQTLLYGAQRLISPLAWSNTFRNFEGHKAYFVGKDWNVDVIAVQPVNGAARNAVYNIKSFDAPASDRWLSGIYATNKSVGNGALDLYFLWSQTDYPSPNVMDGNRYTLGARHAGKKGLSGECDESITLTWDLEGAWQFGETDFLGPQEDVQAGFASVVSGVTFDKAPWTPNISGVFWWGSGDSDPNDGVNNTVSTLYPLGHAYWGLIDNFDGSNLLDYSVQASVKPVSKLTLHTAWHWFDKAARQDAIYNIAGVPFGGVSTTPANIGNELDLLATYQMNPNVQLQFGYFWFWYGGAVSENPNALVANRSDAEQVYLMLDCTF